MATEPLLGFPYPAGTDAVSAGDDAIRALAEAVRLACVMRFASAAARTAAFAAASITLGASHDGLYSYLQDVDLYERWTGSAWTGIGPNSVALSNNIVGSTTTAASYVDMPATSSLSFNKKYTSSEIAIDMHVGLLSTVNSTIARLGVRINSVDYDITEVVFNVSAAHQRGSGSRNVAAGLAAGTYPIQGRWYRTTGTGTLTIGNDWFGLRATEVFPA